jgi:hypothetical protein
MKTSLKLLIVFVEYAESNALLLIQAVNTVDYNRSKIGCVCVIRKKIIYLFI